MSKAIVEKVAEKFNLTKKLAKEVVDVVFDGVVGEIVEGEMKLPGVGTFTVVDKEAREARNPKTGETVSVPAKKALKFKPSANIKRALNGE